MDGRSEQFNEKIVFSVPAKWRFPFSATATRKNDTETEAKSKRNKKKINQETNNLQSFHRFQNK